MSALADDARAGGAATGAGAAATAGAGAGAGAAATAGAAIGDCKVSGAGAAGAAGDPNAGLNAIFDELAALNAFIRMNRRGGPRAGG
jgi:hypothetical protein